MVNVYAAGKPGLGDDLTRYIIANTGFARVSLDSLPSIFDNIEIMVKTTPLHIGELEELMLLALVKVSSDGESSGATIRDALAKVERRVAIGTLYVTLERLQAKGLVVSRISEATNERGGRAKQLFRLTDEGADALRVAEVRRLQLRTKTDLVGDVT